MKRVIFIVLDSAGIGEMPDSHVYGDAGSNTLGHVVKHNKNLKIPNLIKLGLGNIDGAKYIEKTNDAIGSFGKMAELSNGKDTTVGHWELAGVITETPFPTYPNGFPKDIIEKFENAIGRKVIGNCTASGTEIIERFGAEHLKTGNVIVYTSADSVFQVAAHEEIVSIDELYKICNIAREVLGSEHNVARIIARPFLGSENNFYRTKNRKDFSVEPTGTTMLDYIKQNNQNVCAIGKIEDIFCGVGITKSVKSKTNMDGIDKTLEAMDTIKDGIIFTNLVEFDMTYGHRNDVVGYGKALEDFDNRLPEIYSKMQKDDLLVISADHGCDPTTASTDHSREYVPVLLYGETIKNNNNLNTRNSFADLSNTILEFLEIEQKTFGESFYNLIKK